MIVLVIIGLLISAVLVVGNEGVRSAERRATQELLTKLEVALTDRMEALMASRVDPTPAHQWFAATFLPTPNPPLFSDERAQIIARVDQIKREFPDVWFIQNDPTYPINFAAQPYAGAAVRGLPVDAYTLPVGQAIYNNPAANSFGSCPTTYPPLPADYRISGEGVYGASYAARAGILKNLGYAKPGFDGTDNNGNGLIDEAAEGLIGLSAADQATITAHLNNHTHKTARAEMLYSLLTEGFGPFGSAFTPDDFTSREVQDTDGDGLPEFVDPWGQPIQFFRWPIDYHSDTQKGFNPDPSKLYGVYSIFETREQYPFDPNQELMAPAWWSNFSGTNPTQPSPQAIAFSQSFTCLFDPYSSLTSLTYPPNSTPTWDRQGVYPRRAYYTKFLVVSSGPDRLSGVYRLQDGFVRSNMSSPITITTAILGNYTNTANNGTFSAGEGWAPPYDPLNSPSFSPDDLSTLMGVAAADDLANQTFQAPGVGTP
jgi:hypothetical protein